MAGRHGRCFGGKGRSNKQLQRTCRINESELSKSNIKPTSKDWITLYIRVKLVKQCGLTVKSKETLPESKRRGEASRRLFQCIGVSQCSSHSKFGNSISGVANFVKENNYKIWQPNVNEKKITCRNE